MRREGDVWVLRAWTADKAIDAWISMPIGVVTLAERHGGVAVSRESFEAMIAEVAVHVDRFAAQRLGEHETEAVDVGAVGHYAAADAEQARKEADARAERDAASRIERPAVAVTVRIGQFTSRRTVVRRACDAGAQRDLSSLCAGASPAPMRVRCLAKPS